MAARDRESSSRRLSAAAESGQLVKMRLPSHSRRHTLWSSAHVDAFTNAALETSEAILAKAHAIRQLADGSRSRRKLDTPWLRIITERCGRGHTLGEVFSPANGQRRDATAGSAPADARSLLGLHKRLHTLVVVRAWFAESRRMVPKDVIARIRRALADPKAPPRGSSHEVAAGPLCLHLASSRNFHFWASNTEHCTSAGRRAVTAPGNVRFQTRPVRIRPRVLSAQL